MKEQIIIYYKKDKKHTNDYIVKRVLTQEGKNYSILSYYMINDVIKEYPSKLKLSKEKIEVYLFQCRKASFFDHIEYQNIMEEI